MPVSQTIGTISTAPQLGVDSKEVFVQKAETVWGELKDRVPELNTAFGQLNTLEANVNAKEASAATSAAIANNAAATAQSAANATLWVSGQAYTTGQSAISTIDLQTYRANTNTSGTTDPSLSGDWVPILDLSSKQDKLVSGANIASINGNDLTLGGDIVTPNGLAGLSTYTDSVTLTNASNSIITINPSTIGKSITMPDATTMSVKSPVFLLINSSATLRVAIRNSLGECIGFIKENSSVYMSLLDNTTTAGVWDARGSALYGLVGEKQESMFNAFITSDTLSGKVLSVLKLSSSSYIVFVANSSQIYAVVYDTALGFGSPTLIVSTGIVLTYQNTPVITKIDSSNFVISYRSSAVTTNLYARTVTVDGTTITPNTEYSAAIGITPSRLVGCKSGSSYVLAATNASSNKLVAFTISGTVITFGSVYTASENSVENLTSVVPIIGTDKVLVLAYRTSATANGTALLYTISGTGISFSAQSVLNASTAVYGAVNQHPLIEVSTGKFLIFFGNTSCYWINVTQAGDITSGVITVQSTGVNNTQCDTIVNGNIVIRVSSSLIDKIDFTGSTPVVTSASYTNSAYGVPNDLRLVNISSNKVGVIAHVETVINTSYYYPHSNLITFDISGTPTVTSRNPFKGSRIAGNDNRANTYSYDLNKLSLAKQSSDTSKYYDIEWVHSDSLFMDNARASDGYNMYGNTLISSKGNIFFDMESILIDSNSVSLVEDAFPANSMYSWGTNRRLLGRANRLENNLILITEKYRLIVVECVK